MNTTNHTETNAVRGERKPKIQSARKIGHLWQVLYGITGRATFYGYGVTRKQASDEARQRFTKKAQKLTGTPATLQGIGKE